MAETYEDDVMEGLHKTRHAILSRFGDDISQYLDYLAAHPVPGVRYVDPKATKGTGVGYIMPDFPLSLCAGEESSAEYNAKTPSP